METINKLTVILTAAVLVLAVAVGPVAATEAGGEEGPQKIELPERQHDFVGLFILGALGLGAVLALDNARRQLKGERKQASGDFRWR
jgi:hypothetical protein